MTKIKIVGIFIFTIAIILAFLSNYTSEEDRLNKEQLDIINIQKSFTQEISKNIFYIYKHKYASTSQLDDSIKKFISNLESKERKINPTNSTEIKNKNKEIILLWNKFYLLVQNFRDQSEITSAYSRITIDATVNAIYKLNLDLVVKFNELIEINTIYNKNTINGYKNLQYFLFFILVLLLIYLFTQLQSVISFIQKFTNTSKNIITNSSIKELEPIEVNNNSNELLEASKNFNTIVDRINNSIQRSSSSMQHSYESLELIEDNVEDLLEFLSVMDDGGIDKELTKKEDAIIQSLEELTSVSHKLANLKVDLDNLISHHNSNNY